MNNEQFFISNWDKYYFLRFSKESSYYYINHSIILFKYIHVNIKMFVVLSIIHKHVIIIT